MKKISLAIVDDHVLYRQGLAMMIRQEPAFSLLFEASNGREFINKLDHQQPDVVILGRELPVIDGATVLKFLKSRRNAPRAILLAISEELTEVLKMIRLGAKAYLPKTAQTHEIRDAVFAVTRNGFHCTPLVSEALLYREKHLSPTNWVTDNSLTPREAEVVKLVCQECTSTEIAKKLKISPRTVENHRKKIMVKVGARNMAGVIIYAVKHGMVE